MSSSPFFSIVIPLYNKESALRTTLDSCFSQKFKDYEVVVVDDGSTDGSVSAVKECTDERVVLIEQENSGPSAARNCGGKAAKGEWIVFLDADDLLLPDALSNFHKLVTTYPDINAFCCNFYVEREGEEMLYSDKYKNGIVRNNFFSWLTKRLMPRTGALCLRRSVFLQSPFNESLRRYEDAEMLFKLFRREKFVTCSHPVMVNRLSFRAASGIRKNINEDFVWSVEVKGKFWEKVACYELFMKREVDYKLKVNHNFFFDTVVLFLRLLQKL